MLEYIFGSKTRHKLLHLFFKNQSQIFFVRELSRKIGTQINAVRREIEKLVAAQVIIDAKSTETSSAAKGLSRAAEAKRKYFRWHKDGPLNQELQSLLLKDDIISERRFIDTLKNLNGVDVLILSGRFTGIDDSPTDLLVVGNITHKETQRLVRLFEQQSGNDLRYTVMTKKEFAYRRDVADRFLTDLFGRKHVVAVDRLNKSA